LVVVSSGLRRLPVIDWLLVAYIENVSLARRLLVQIIWFYYALPVVLGVNIPAHVAAISVLSLYGGAFYAEIIRGSIESIHVGQWDRAGAGLEPMAGVRLVILRSAYKTACWRLTQSVRDAAEKHLAGVVIAVPDLVYNAT